MVYILVNNCPNWGINIHGERFTGDRETELLGAQNTHPEILELEKQSHLPYGLGPGDTLNFRPGVSQLQ